MLRAVRGNAARMTRSWAAGLLTLASLAGGALAQDLVRSSDGTASASDAEAERVVVVGRASDILGVATSPSEGVVSAADLATRPVFRPGEIMETIPGVIVPQHSGSGKANQYFLRGFNLDHGTDLVLCLGDFGGCLS